MEDENEQEHTALKLAAVAVVGLLGYRFVYRPISNWKEHRRRQKVIKALTPYLTQIAKEEYNKNPNFTMTDLLQRAQTEREFWEIVSHLV